MTLKYETNLSMVKYDRKTNRTVFFMQRKGHKPVRSCDTIAHHLVTLRTLDAMARMGHAFDSEAETNLLPLKLNNNGERI